MGEEATYQFEIALDKIEELTEQNNKLQKRIFELQNKSSEITIEPNSKDRSEIIFKEADAAMKRFTNKLRKELSNAKSKQGQGKPV